MNGAELGAKESPSAAPTDQIVVPLNAAPVSSAHVNTAPPQSSTSMPRCFLYQAPKACGSRALKKIPPMPVTRFIGRLRWDDSRVASISHQVLRDCVVRGQRQRIQIDVGALRVRRESSDHHFGSRIDVNRLTMDSTSRERAVLVVGDPPHVAVAPSG